MRAKPKFWAVLSLLLFAGAIWMWHYGNVVSRRAATAREAALRHAPGVLFHPPATNAIAKNKSYRLTNTRQNIAQLLHNKHALILRNAWIDTETPVALQIPEHLRAKGAPGSYLVQSDRPLDKAFYAELSKAGAKYVSYVPNNAALVEASPIEATNLSRQPDVVAVLPYEPYYKLDSSLLPAAVEQQAQSNALSVTTFPGERDAALTALTQLGAKLIGEDRSPFGPTLVVSVPANSLVAVAQLPLAQEIETYTPRRVMNDLTRVVLGVATNSLIGTPNYLNLSGANVTVNINDTGVDASHPDFAPTGRLLADFPSSLVDDDGHGTHVAGIIAGNGSESKTVPNPESGKTNVPGSIIPGADFRGKATNATLFVQSLDLTFGPYISDAFLQENAASNLGPTNLISNNSWGYPLNRSAVTGSPPYDMHAASFDAATRDALPAVKGEQPLLFVFSAGNSGAGTDSGVDGTSDTIVSPATAKNVITVGSSDSLRNITNKVSYDGMTTNAVFLGSTDNTNLVSSFSSCGNVGVGVEGLYGRFKPDVVAPGVFIISCRSSNYVDPSNATFVNVSPEPGQVVKPGQTNYYPYYIPPDASELVLILSSNASSPNPFPNLLITSDVNYPPQPVVSSNNFYAFTNFTPGTLYWFGVTPTNGQPAPVNYDLTFYLFETNSEGDYFQVLSNLNDVLKPYYRYESGTSMSAGAVSGMLALMQEFLQSRMNITNPSPALLKAMLINGARSLNPLYDFHVNTISQNEQGWGLPNLPNSVPASLTNANPSMVLLDQSSNNALATGQYQTYTINCTDSNVSNFPLRISLVWTDPPGDPAAGIALVNNLDLTVSDQSGSNIYVGNDFRSGDIFTEPSSPTNLPPGLDNNTVQNVYVVNGASNLTAAGDSINNVQNVYINPTNLAGAFPLTVTISGTRINVNAVPGQTNNIMQDYALVISSDDPNLTAPLTLVSNPVVTYTPVLVTIASNATPLLHERVGANEPNLYNYPAGTTNGNVSQWHFFVFTNDQFSATNQATNVAFATFLSPNLSIPRASGSADIDLYVSTNSGLTNLIPSVVESADKSVGRGGTETITYSNSTPNKVYYIGVKSEDQQASDFGFFGIAQQAPFSSANANGNNVTATGTSLPVYIPNALSPQPALVFAFLVNPNPSLQKIRRVTVTLGVQHGNPSDLYGTLQHNGITTVLNHNTGGIGGFTNMYDDLGEDPNSGDIPSDPPGSLTEFVGQPPDGLWLLTEADDYQGVTGYVTTFNVSVDLQEPTSGFLVTIPPQSWYDGYVDVPNDATNMIIDALFQNGGSGPIGIYLTNAVGPLTTNDYGSNNIGPPGGSLTLGTNNPPPGWPPGTPPLAGGTWYYGIYNQGSTPITLYVQILIQESLTPNLVQRYTNSIPIPLTTDAHTQSQICISNGQQIVDLQVGLVVSDTNMDDLSIHLISPEGTSVLLYENRGGTNTGGLGYGTVATNGGTNVFTNYVYTVFTEDTNLASIPIKFAPPPYAYPTVAPLQVLFTNSFETVTNGVYTNGAVLEGWLVTNNVVMITATNPPVFVTNGEVGIVTDVNGELLTNVSGTNVIVTNTLGSNYLALTSARIIQTFGVTNKFTITNGQPYELIYYAKPMGVVDWWLGDSNPYDIIGTNDGTVLSNDVGYAVGEVNNAFQFAGTNATSMGNEVDFGTNVGNFGTNDFTIDFWIKTPPGQQGTYAILEKRQTCDSNFSFLDIHMGQDLADPASVSGDMFMDLSGSNGVSYGNVNANKPINDGLFHHAAFVRNGVNLLLYIDGVLNTNTVTPGVAYISNTNIFRIGQSQCVPLDGSQPFNGDLDELDVIDRALSPAEVYAIYHAGSLGKYSTNSIYPNFDLTIDGVSTNTIILSNATGGWQLFTNIFYATNDQVTVEFSGHPMGVLLDDIQLVQLPATNYNNYFLPEEPLGPFIGQNPLGCWTLDVWDTRNDSPNPVNGTLLAWNLQVTTSSTNASVVVLTNENTAVTNVQPGSISYFAVDVPSYATYATNVLYVRGSTPVSLIFNQTELPTGYLPGDIYLTNNQLPTEYSSNVISTFSGFPPLLPGQRYFLGVQNNSTTVAKFNLEVDFNVNSNTVTPLSNNVPFNNFPIGVGAQLATSQYYSFVVPTNAIMVTFQITNVTPNGSTNGEVDLYVNRGLPLPGPTDFDFESANPGPNDQFIVITTNSIPVGIPVATTNTIAPLTPTTWYLCANDFDTNVILTYTIVATYITNGQLDVIPLTNDIPYTNTAPPGYPTNLLYSFTITNSPSGVEFLVTNLTNIGNVQLLADIDNIPTPQISFAGSFNAGTNSQFIQILPNAALPSLNGVWYLSVPNTSTTNVPYTITALTNFILPPPLEPLTWTGSVDDYWDILATSNWIVTGSVPPTNYPYQDNSMVTFDDSAPGTTMVDLSTTLSPASLTVSNNLKSYTFFGPGSLAGGTGINMAGTGSATFTESGGDSFLGGITQTGGSLTYAATGVSIAGGVSITGGTLILDQTGVIAGPVNIGPGATLQVGNNDANGGLTIRPVQDNGSLVFDQTNVSTVNNIIKGTGTVSQIGSGTVALAGLNTYSGATYISNGILVVDNTNALGPWTGGAVNISGAGTLDLGGLSSNAPGSLLFGAKPFNISGAGFGGIGAIVNDGTIPQLGDIELINLTSNASVGGQMLWTIGALPGSNTLNLNNYTLTKTGSNQVSLVNTIITAGNLVINQGVLSIEATPQFASPATVVTVNPGGYVGQNLDTFGSFTNQIVLDGGGTTNVSGGGVTYLDAPILVASNSTLGNGGGTEIFDGIISGSNGLSIFGPGTNVFTATNSYLGPTYVEQGTLVLSNYSSIGNSGQIVVAPGATLSTLPRVDGALTLTNSQSLTVFGLVNASNVVALAGTSVSGNGVINSNLTINPGAYLSIGTNAANIGTLPVGGTAVLGGTTYLKIQPFLSPAQSNDVLAVSNIVYGGTLVVTNLGPTNAFFAGQTFTLFPAATSSGAFALETLPPLPVGLAWSTTFASNGPGLLIVQPNMQPSISSFTVNLGQNSAVFTGTNGIPGGEFIVLTATNVAVPLASWQPVLTNYFDGNGNFNFTNGLGTNGQQYFIIKSP
jgi:autotransporter-associated beta strand protein